jgi:hypothetical protein
MSSTYSSDSEYQSRIIKCIPTYTFSHGYGFSNFDVNLYDVTLGKRHPAFIPSLEDKLHDLITSEEFERKKSEINTLIQNFLGWYNGAVECNLEKWEEESKSAYAIDLDGVTIAEQRSSGTVLMESDESMSDL